MVERGIGRGLAAILPPVEQREAGLQQIPVQLIRPNPRQPRVSIAEEGVQALAASIQSHGVIQPVLVKALSAGGYELIAGERRWRAARAAGLDEIPAVVRAVDDTERLELALIENMAREDLNPVDAARACAALVDELGLSKEEVGRRVGRSRVAISNLVRLLDLPDAALSMLESGELTEGHGRALLQAPGPKAQRDLAREARALGLSVRETETRARALSAGGSAPQSRDLVVAERSDADAAREQAEEALSAALGVEVRVRLRRSGGCAVEIPLEGLDDVRAIVRRIAGPMAA